MICVADFGVLGDLRLLKCIGLKNSRDADLIASLRFYVYILLEKI